MIAFADIEDIEKRSTAIFIPNAILISTASSKVMHLDNIMHAD